MIALFHELRRPPYSLMEVHLVLRKRGVEWHCVLVLTHFEVYFAALSNCAFKDISNMCSWLDAHCLNLICEDKKDLIKELLFADDATNVTHSEATADSDYDQNMWSIFTNGKYQQDGGSWTRQTTLIKHWMGTCLSQWTGSAVLNLQFVILTLSPLMKKSAHE